MGKPKARRAQGSRNAQPRISQEPAKELRFPWLGIEDLRQAGNTAGINSEHVCIVKRAGNQPNQTLDAKFFSEDGVAPLSTFCAS